MTEEEIKAQATLELQEEQKVNEVEKLSKLVDQLKAEKEQIKQELDKAKVEIVKEQQRVLMGFNNVGSQRKEMDINDILKGKL